MTVLTYELHEGVRCGRHRSVHSLFTHAVALRLGQTEKNMERFTNLRVILAQGPC